MTISRRRFIIGGGLGAVGLGVGGLGLVEKGVLPGRSRLHGAAGGCGNEADPPSDTPGPMRDGSFTSAARDGRTVGWSVAYPPGFDSGAALPVCIALPGRGGDHSSPFSGLGVERFLAAGVAAGVPPFVVASAGGGDSTYWHPRLGGDDPQRMVIEEFLPVLAKTNLIVDRVGFIGWSMGGYGALLFAESMTSSRVATVAAASPALWRTSGETADGAFDNAADFEAHDVFKSRAKLAGIALSVDCGNDDPFFSATKDFVSALPQPARTRFEPGCHDAAFWKRMLPAQIRFMGDSLANA